MPRRLVKNDPDEVRQRLMQRNRWPVAMLAEVLGCSRKAIYRRARDGDWVIEAGRIATKAAMKVFDFKARYKPRLVKRDRAEIREKLKEYRECSVPLLADILGCSREAIYRRIRRGEWPLESKTIPTEWVIGELEL